MFDFVRSEVSQGLGLKSWLSVTKKKNIGSKSAVEISFLLNVCAKTILKNVRILSTKPSGVQSEASSPCDTKTNKQRIDFAAKQRCE